MLIACRSVTNFCFKARQQSVSSDSRPICYTFQVPTVIRKTHAIFIEKKRKKVARLGKITRLSLERCGLNLNTRVGNSRTLKLHPHLKVAPNRHGDSPRSRAVQLRTSASCDVYARILNNFFGHDFKR